MINKTEISGWLGRMSFQSGWSRKIPKRKWMILQILFPIIGITAVLLILAIFINYKSWISSVWIAYFIALFANLFGHKDWDRDHQKIRDKENEETVTL